MDNLQSAPPTYCDTKAGLAAGTTSTLTQALGAGATANVYCIRGKKYLAPALANTATPTADWATGTGFLPVLANKGSVFMVGFNAAGQLKAIQGQVVDLDASGNFLTAPQFGALGPAGSAPGAGGSNDFCPIGYILVQAGATANNTTGWLFGTHNFTGVAGVTCTFDDICAMLDRPQIN